MDSPAISSSNLVESGNTMYREEILKSQSAYVSPLHHSKTKLHSSLTGMHVACNGITFVSNTYYRDYDCLKKILVPQNTCPKQASGHNCLLFGGLNSFTHHMASFWLHFHLLILLHSPAGTWVHLCCSFWVQRNHHIPGLGAAWGEGQDPG